MERRVVNAVFGIALALGCSALQAGPVQDFEAAFRNAYADYRAALFATNSGDAGAAAKAMAGFEAKWNSLLARWGAAPPPQYEDDASWPVMLDRVAAILAEARAAIASGRLQQAHEALERFRDEIGALHARNAIATFSDHMNAYHEAMERVLTDGYGGFDAAGRRRLDADLAVLAYLAANLEKYRPLETQATADFRTLLGELQRSIASARELVPAGEAAALGRAVAGLKPAYSKFFLRFG